VVIFKNEAFIQPRIRMKRLYNSKQCMKCMVVDPRQELDLIQIYKWYLQKLIKEEEGFFID